MNTQTIDLEDLWEEEAVEPPHEAEEPDTDGEQVLDLAKALIGRFVGMPSDAALTVSTLWAIHTHVVDADGHLAFDVSPRIAWLSNKPASGKTKALEMVASLSYNGQLLVDPTPAAFSQLVHEYFADPAIDEIDILFGAGNAKRVLRSLLLAGYRRKGAFWMRSGKPPISIFGPVSFAGLDRKFRAAEDLAALRSRTIMIHMKPREGNMDNYVPRMHDPFAEAVRKDISKWVRRHTAEILETWPTMPEGIKDRKAELSEPLLQIADVVGGKWPKMAREALQELLLDKVEDDDVPLTERLLDALHEVFGTEEKLTTVNIITRLYELDPQWLKLWPSPMTAPRELSAALNPLGVGPCPIRIGERVAKGYKRSDLAPLWGEGNVTA